MLTQTYRPRKFSDVVGQPVPIEVLKSMAKDPESSPRSVILEGAFGTGKTTLSRIFAKATNCKQFKKLGDLCGVCDICNAPVDSTSFYQEFDSSAVGSVESIRSLRDDFFLSTALTDWRVIVLDECHLCSRQAQSALLKVLEENTSNLTIMFATTDIDKVLPTIRSRSVELTFSKISFSELEKAAKRIIESEQIEISPELLSRVIFSSRGHARNMVMLLDLYQMSENKETFGATLKSSEYDLLRLLLTVKSEPPVFAEILGQVLRSTLEVLKEDLNAVLFNAIQYEVTGEVESIYREQYVKLKELLGQDIFKLFKYAMAPWASTVFKSDLTLQAFLWSVFYLFNSQGSSQKPAGTTLLDRAKVRR